MVSRAWRRGLLAGLGLALVGLGTGAYAAGGDCKSEPACTLIGCSNAVLVTLKQMPAEAHRARLCVDGRCGKVGRIYRDGPSQLFARMPRKARREGVRVSVRVVVLDRRGGVLARIIRRPRVRRFSPNGEECGPTCFGAGFTVRGGSGRFTVS